MAGEVKEDILAGDVVTTVDFSGTPTTGLGRIVAQFTPTVTESATTIRDTFFDNYTTRTDELYAEV